MGSDAGDRAVIEAAIPHRDPFLFVDRIVERTAGTIVTELEVRPDLDCFRGHYPGEPILPGVLVCELAFQSAALLFAAPGAADPESAAPRSTAPAAAVPLLTRIEEARFKQVVRPGETLRAEITLLETLGPARYVAAHVRSGGRTVLRIRFTVALAVPALAGGPP